MSKKPTFVMAAVQRFQTHEARSMFGFSPTTDITNASCLDHELQPGLCRAATFRKAKPQDIFGQGFISNHFPPAAASARPRRSSRGICFNKAYRSTWELGLYSGTSSLSIRMSCVTSRTAQICRSVSRDPLISS
jgi:hypothetical protein